MANGENINRQSAKENHSFDPQPLSPTIPQAPVTKSAHHAVHHCAPLLVNPHFLLFLLLPFKSQRHTHTNTNTHMHTATAREQRFNRAGVSIFTKMCFPHMCSPFLLWIVESIKRTFVLYFFFLLLMLLAGMGKRTAGTWGFYLFVQRVLFLLLGGERASVGLDGLLPVVLFSS